MKFHRFVTRMTATLLLGCTLVTPALAANGIVVTEGSNLRVRTEASTEAEIVDYLSDGAKVEILSEAAEGWYQVSYGDITGYVSSDYVVEDKPYIRVDAGPLNIRTAPSTESEKAGHLAEGKVVEVLETLEGWYRIESGYVCADYVTEVDATALKASGKGQEVVDYAMSFLGSRYVHGGSSPKGFDCSGFTSYVYKHFGISISRTASGQLDNGTPVSRGELRPGDLVMFKKGGGSKRASHVGLYIGNNKFVHAANSRLGVIVSSLSETYYDTGFIGARRLV